MSEHLKAMPQYAFIISMVRFGEEMPPFHVIPILAIQYSAEAFYVKRSGQQREIQ